MLPGFPFTCIDFAADAVAAMAAAVRSRIGYSHRFAFRWRATGARTRQVVITVSQARLHRSGLRKQRVS
jgi:hypothetical protein